MWPAVAAIVDAIAIVITLLYLATQTKQNAAAIAASVRQEMFANDLTYLSDEMEFRSCQLDGDNTWSSPECLTVSFLIFLRSRENNRLQYRDGAIDKDTFALRIIKPGEFDRYRKHAVEGGELDGQFKTLKLTTDQAFADEFNAESSVTLSS
jgi:hypothetical protein